MTSKTQPTLRAFALGAALAVAAIGSIGSTNAAALPGLGAAARPAIAIDTDAETDAEKVQYRGGYYRGGPAPRAYGPGPGRGYYVPGPRHYAPGPRYYGPPRVAGPRWGYRPWYHRPYYGTIIGGLALGTIIGVTAYGLAPRAPRPDLCWYWADEVQSRGYWDYC